jgi:hypothetical protein
LGVSGADWRLLPQRHAHHGRAPSATGATWFSATHYPRGNFDEIPTQSALDFSQNVP